MEKQKVIVYVDGFNFYYGLKNARRDRSVADDGKRISLSLKDYLPLTVPLASAKRKALLKERLMTIVQ